MLHEVGAYINRSGRRRHTYYVISHSEIFATRRCSAASSPRRRATLANLFLTQRPGDEGAAGIEQIHVAKAVALLRLARALDQVARRGRRVEGPGASGRTSALAPQTAPPEGIELELWAVQQEKNYFETVFGRELLAEAC